MKIIFLVLLLLTSLTFSPVYAQEPAKLVEILKPVETIIRLLAPVAAVAFFIMVLVGGYKFITAGGDQKQIAGAKTTLTYALLGVILVVASWLILVLIKNITGVDVTNVDIPTTKNQQPRPDDR